MGVIHKYQEKQRHTHKWLILNLVLLALLASGCVTLKDPETFQEESNEVVGLASRQVPVGQTVVSRRSGLNGAWLWLSLPPDVSTGSGGLILELFHSPGEDQSLTSARVRLEDIRSAIPVYISFDAQNDPPGQSYYLSLSTDQGEVQAMGVQADVYPEGSAFIDSLPAQGDLAFRLTYDYGLGAALADFLGMLRSSWLAIPLGLVLFLPGWLLLDIFNLQQDYDFGQRAALSLGLSLAAIPVLMTWTSTFGLAWGKISVTISAGILSALALWRLARRKAWRTLVRPSQTSVALLVVTIAALFVRYAMVRDLAAPPWVDSVHHGMITRLILEHGGFPDSYAPYLEIDSARYHSGFHSGLASFLWLSGLDIAQGMLVYGQVLNALMVLGVYLLARRLGVDPRGGVLAALIAGFLTPMPAYYTSWGRYTQLAGLLILPTVFTLLQGVLDAKLPADRMACGKLALLAGVAGGGLFLTHYRVALFGACLVGAELLVRTPGTLWHRWRHTTELAQIEPSGNSDFVGVERVPRHLQFSDVAWLALAGIIGILLILPWLPETVGGFIAPKLSTWSRGKPPFFEGFSWTFLTTAWGTPSLWLAGLGFVAGLLRRNRFPITLLLWVGLLFTFSNLGALGLPGSNFVNTLSVEISLFIPIAILGGYFIGQALALLDRFTPPRWLKYTGTAAWLGAGLICIFAVRALLPILNPVTFLYRQADRPALTWIANNLPDGETVLINPFAWGYGIYAGNDGGYWITPLTGHPTMPPPVLYGLDNDPKRIQQISQFSQEVVAKGGQAKALSELMQAQGIQYVYTGRRGGPISPQALSESPLFEVLFNQGGTWVFYRK